MDPYRLKLLSLSNEITERELADLKFICKEHIPAGVLEKVRRPLELFDELENRSLVSTDNKEFLAAILAGINRGDLGDEFLGDVMTGSESSPISQFQNTLSDHYQHEIGWLQPLAWNESFRIHIKHIYTNLQMITQTTQGRVTRKDPLESYLQMFQARPGFPEPKRILIEGKAGVGKTTFLSLLVYDWACGNPGLQHFKLVLFMELKQMKGNLKNDIFDLLFPRDFKFSADYIFQYIVGHQESVLFVLDGYDEVKPSQLQDAQDLITRKLLKDATVVVTSRPGKGSRTHWFMDLRTEITGFTNENMHEFVFKYFEDDVSAAKSLLSELEMHPVAENIAELPLTATLICALWEEMPHSAILSSMSSLFIELTLLLVKIFYARKGGDCNFDADRISSLEDIPEDLFQSLLSLGEMSLNGLLNDQLIFDVVDIENKCVNKGVLDVGLLSKESSASRLKPVQKCRFLHRSYQEFLAGLWLSSKIREAFANPSRFEEVGVYVMKCLASELNSVLFSFTPGLLGNAFHSFFDLLLQEGTVHVSEDEALKQSFFRVCVLSLYESSQGQLAFKLDPQMPDKDVIRLEALTVSPYTMRALVYFLQNRPSIRSFVLEDSEVHKQALNVLIRFLPQMPFLKELHFLRNSFACVDNTSFCGQIQEQLHLEKISFKANGFGPEGCKSFAQLLKHCSKLQQLEFSDSSAESDGMQAIFFAFKSFPYLSQLKLSGNKLTCNDAVALASALKLTPRLTHLTLKTECQMGAKGVVSLLQTVPEAAPCLQQLALKNVNKESSETERICAAVGEACGKLDELTHLDLSDNNLSNGSFIGNCIMSCQNLTSLNLSRNLFGDAGASALAEKLSQLVNLEELLLNENKLGCPGLISLSAAIKSNRRLRSIGLHSNVISDEGIESLARCFSSFKHLDRLELAKNPITDHGLSTLISQFREVPDLRLLNLRRNNLSEAGFVALALALPLLPKLEVLTLSSPVKSTSPTKKDGSLPKEEKCLATLSQEAFDSLMSAAHSHKSLQTIHVSLNAIPLGTDQAKFDRLKL